MAATRADRYVRRKGDSIGSVSLVRRMKSSGTIWLGILIGSTIGGFIPGLWGADLLSYSGVLFSGLGAFVGLWIGYKMA